MRVAPTSGTAASPAFTQSAATNETSAVLRIATGGRQGRFSGHAAKWALVPVMISK